MLSEMSRMPGALRLTYESGNDRAKIKGGKHMKYILLMTGTKAGVDTYRVWTKEDIGRHMARLKSLAKD